MQIAIDGPAGAGKSTIAKKIARELDFFYIDTGAMYRALTWMVIQTNTDYKDEKAVYSLAQKTNIHFSNRPGEQRIICNGKDVSDVIRSPEVNNLVSQISALPLVRTIMVLKQQTMAENMNVVMEGRDIGECVLPQADYKFFITAGLEERCQRRARELKERGYDQDYTAIKEEMISRDKMDSARDIGALKILKDSIVINSSNLSIEELFSCVIAIIRGEKNVV